MQAVEDSQSGQCVRRSLGEWFATCPGQLLLDEERRCMERSLQDLFGYHLLQVGHLGRQDLLAASRITHRVVLDIETPIDGRPGNGPVARPDALPVGSDTVDVMVLPHVLEFEADPHQVLREIQRVLIPEGHLIITGFNPWSLWGLWRRVMTMSGRASPPWCGRFFSQHRIRDWLSLLGFDLVDHCTVLFRPPLSSSKVMARLAGMEKFGERFIRQLGGAYIIIARKRVITLTPVRPRWKQNKAMVGAGIAEPTTRQGAGRLHH